MKAGVLAIAAAVASGVSAGHAGRHAHEAFHVERGLLLTTGAAPQPTCGCTTVYTTITGEATLIGVAPKSSTSTSTSTSTTSSSSVSASSAASSSSSSTAEALSTSTSAAPAQVTTEAAAPVALPTSTTSILPTSSTSAAPMSSSSSSSSSGSPSSNPGSSTSLGSSGDQWAVTYTPYNPDNGACVSAGQVLIDMALIKLKGFTTVRLYSTDCNTLENVGAACEISGLKMILGVYISESGTSGAQDQVDAIASWAKWDLVELVIIGNEAVFNNFCTASELAAFISAGKSTISAAGYTGPYTTAETLGVWYGATSELCSVVDVTGCNIHPFFNADISADQAGSFVTSQLEIVDGLCSGKAGVNLETGWPSAGSCNGAACPGTSEQATAVASIKAAAGGKSVMFSMTNDKWKPLGSFDCEQSWGMINLFPDL